MTSTLFLTLALATPLTDDAVAVAAGDRVETVRMLSSMQEELDDGDLAVVLHPDGAFLQFTSSLEFRDAKAKLVRGQRRQLKDMAATLLDHPDLSVRLVGHADERPVVGGPYDDNAELARARALTARDRLVALGVDEGRLSIASAADDDPTAAGAPVARDLNRRVEVMFLPDVHIESLEVDDRDDSAGFGMGSTDGIASLN